MIFRFKMCILFMYVAKTEKESKVNTSKSRFKLVIASNRDESFLRPTRPAKFWDSDPNILAGQDCQEGGTWLGISKTGKAAILLNIMSKPPKEKLRTRGDLVTEFLRSDPELRGMTYCSNLHQAKEFDIRKDYAPFNLITIDMLSPRNTSSRETVLETEPHSNGREKSFDVTYFTNWSPDPPKVLTDGECQFFAFGNNIYSDPFTKVANGSKEFETIIGRHSDATTDNCQELQESILQFLKSSTRYPDDPAMKKLVQEVGVTNKPIDEYSSIFVKTDGLNTGTRTHTIVFVDFEDNAIFHEWTMEEPINAQDPKWMESEYRFKLELL